MLMTAARTLVITGAPALTAWTHIRARALRATPGLLAKQVWQLRPNEMSVNALQNKNKFVAADVDDCSPNPCQHGGICMDGVDSFTCNCDGTGYDGSNCGASKFHVIF